MEWESLLNTYKLKISYDGTDYYGWQIQPNVKTIQGDLNQTIAKVFNDDSVLTMASGRTDSGVHARAQVVKLSLSRSIPSANLKKGLNDTLPTGIKIIEACECDESFHPIQDSLSKEYRYYLSFEDPGLFLYRYVAHFQGDFDLAKLEKGMDFFHGEKSFHNFFCVGTPVNSYIREIFEADLSQLNQVGPFGVEGRAIFCLKFRGSGFLKQMVRLMVGTLLDYAQGKISAAQFEDLFDPELKSERRFVAPAHGLFLHEVSYA
ncbi:MAG: tRNA pseudouridine(38-40) synthase TruA [Bacteriovoracaceae bacterium]